MRKAVVAIMRNGFGQILGVSRKTDKTVFGLPGGKVDAGETVEEAIRREVFEETGLTITKLYPIDDREYGVSVETTYHQHCFAADWVGQIRSTDETDALGEGRVEWLDSSVFETGFFSDYNVMMFGKLAELQQKLLNEK